MAMADRFGRIAGWPLGGLVVLMMIVGCSGNGTPDLGSITGTVTLDGQPLAGAGVVFKPEGARHSVARTDEKGHFELTYLRDLRGAVVGEHIVRITTADTEAEVPETLPARYNRESTLQRTVKPGDNHFTFDLTSD